MAREVTRRQLLAQAGTAAAGVAGLSMVGCSSAAHSSPVKPVGSGAAELLPESVVVDGFHKFVTRPDINPPVITLTRKLTGPQGHHFFLNAPYNAPGHGGAMLLDPSGNLVWMGPDSKLFHKLDFNVQTYAGEPHLTWWEGHETHGWGQGVAVIADKHYARKRTIHAVGSGVNLDHHEFNVTPQDTGLVSIFKTMPGTHDLSSIGGPKHGVLVSGVAQEIDIKTNKLLLDWNSFERGVSLRESYQTVKGFGAADNPYDFFHINSIAPTLDGKHLLISSRNCWTVFKIDRKTGHIVWRLGGKRSDFTHGPGAHFAWQHHVRPHPGGLMTVFDNGSTPPVEKQSRALVLHVDEEKMHVSLTRQYTHPGTLVLSGAEGSAQLLPNGNMFVGWGSSPFFSEFSEDGKLLVEADMLKDNPSYRTFAGDWTGHPSRPPEAVAHTRDGKNVVYVSWNGSTETKSWTVLAGSSRSSLKAVGSVPKTGFETTILVKHKGPFFAVEAHDSKGHLLRTSATVKIS